MTCSMTDRPFASRPQACSRRWIGSRARFATSVILADNISRRCMLLLLSRISSLDEKQSVDLYACFQRKCRLIGDSLDIQGMGHGVLCCAILKAKVCGE